MNLNMWALKWGVPFSALEDLRREFGILDHGVDLTVGKKNDRSESSVQSIVRLEASKKGLRLWRNNVGAGHLDNGNFIRWGLCNDSQRMNSRIKSSDLIGMRKRLIMPDDVGHVIAQLVVRETKAANWVWKGDEHEQAQLRFLQLVASYGGDAAFTTGEGSL